MVDQPDGVCAVGDARRIEQVLVNLLINASRYSGADTSIRVGVTPMPSGYRLGSTMEFAGYDSTLRRERLDLLRAGASHYLREPTAEPVEEEWWGWRPMVYDGKPIIDRSPAFDNVLIAAGHGMLGLSMAPATGKLVAELSGGATPHIDPGPYALRRFR